MRIDYNVPKQSYSNNANRSTSRKDSGVGSTLLVIVITGAIMFATGFGAGWFLSQKAAKKSFQQAMEQNSLENTPPSPPKQQAPAQTPNPTQPQQPSTVQTTQSAPQSPQGATQAPAGGAPDPALSFYKTLPNGQKSNVIGSGINAAKEEKTKQPLQAPIPSNIGKPQAAPPSEQPRPADKGAAPKQEPGGLTVQVASYSLKSEAEAHRQKLANKGYNAFISETNLGDKGIWYRVRVGKKLDPEAAKELAAKLGKGALPTPDKD